MLGTQESSIFFEYTYCDSLSLISLIPQANQLLWVNQLHRDYWHFLNIKMHQSFNTLLLLFCFPFCASLDQILGVEFKTQIIGNSQILICFQLWLLIVFFFFLCFWARLSLLYALTWRTQLWEYFSCLLLLLL